MLLETTAFLVLDQAQGLEFLSAQALAFGEDIDDLEQIGGFVRGTRLEEPVYLFLELAVQLEFILSLVQYAGLSRTPALPDKLGDFVARRFEHLKPYATRTLTIVPEHQANHPAGEGHIEPDGNRPTCPGLVNIEAALEGIID